MINEEQREARRKFIGSSDAPAIVGLDPSRSSLDVWADKTGSLERKENGGRGRNRLAMDMGLFLEDAVLTWGEQRMGRPLTRDGSGNAGRMLIHPNGVMAANLDGLVLDGEPIIVEAKTSGIVGRLAWDDWGEEGSDDVPDRVLVQVCHQFAVARAALDLEIKRAVVPALLGGRGFVLFEIPYKPDLVESIVASELEFWRKHIETRQPPDGLFSESTLRRLLRVEGKVVPISSGVVERWRDAKAAAKAADLEKHLAERELLSALGDAEIGEFDGGRIGYKQQVRKAYTTEVQESTFRVLREMKTTTTLATK